MRHAVMVVLVLLLPACGGPAARPATEIVASAGAGCREGEVEQCVVACSNGASDACNEAGRAYEMGVGVIKSGVAANTYYRKACDLGDPAGCYNAGYLLENGMAGRRDVGCALALYRHACDAGHAQSCLGAAEIYRIGAPEVLADKALAAEFLRKACGAGSTKACNKLE